MKMARCVVGAEAAPDDDDYRNDHDDGVNDGRCDSETSGECDGAGKYETVSDVIEKIDSGAAKVEMATRDEDIADSLAACSLLTSSRSV